MILRIGNNFAFTLVEVMLGACILALSSILIYQSVFVLTDAYQRYKLTLETLPWLNEKIYQTKEILRNFGSSFTQSQGRIFFAGREYLWEINLNLLKETKDYQLYEFSLILFDSWKKNFRQIRQGYTLYEKK